MKEKDVKLLEAVMIGGELHKAGATVTLPAAEADSLVRRKKAKTVGAVEDSEDERPARRASKAAKAE